MTALSATCDSVSAADLALSRGAEAIPPAVRRGAWQLKAGQATTLQPKEAHVLKVRQGRLWVTLDATAHWGSEDLVLAPGESLRVPAGQRLVMEAWDQYGATWSWDRAE